MGLSLLGGMASAQSTDLAKITSIDSPKNTYFVDEPVPLHIRGVNGGRCGIWMQVDGGNYNLAEVNDAYSNFPVSGNNFAFKEPGTYVAHAHGKDMPAGLGNQAAVACNGNATFTFKVLALVSSLPLYPAGPRTPAKASSSGIDAGKSMSPFVPKH